MIKLFGWFVDLRSSLTIYYMVYPDRIKHSFLFAISYVEKDNRLFYQFIGPGFVLSMGKLEQGGTH